MKLQGRYRKTALEWIRLTSNSVRGVALPIDLSLIPGQTKKHHVAVFVPDTQVGKGRDGKAEYPTAMDVLILKADRKKWAGIALGMRCSVTVATRGVGPGRFVYFDGHRTVTSDLILAPSGFLYWIDLDEANIIEENRDVTGNVELAPPTKEFTRLDVVLYESQG